MPQRSSGRSGFSVALFDSMLENPEQGFPEALARHRPKVVAIYEDNFNFLSKMCLTRMRQVAFGMIDAAKAYGSKVVVNGSDASDHSREYLERGADYILLGEAEGTLLELTRVARRALRAGILRTSVVWLTGARAAGLRFELPCGR